MRNDDTVTGHVGSIFERETLSVLFCLFFFFFFGHNLVESTQFSSCVVVSMTTRTDATALKGNSKIHCCRLPESVAGYLKRLDDNLHRTRRWPFRMETANDACMNPQPFLLFYFIFFRAPRQIKSEKHSGSLSIEGRRRLAWPKIPFEIVRGCTAR